MNDLNEKEKTVFVESHYRTWPASPPWDGAGNKPGPKVVHVQEHVRSAPTKKTKRA